MRRLNEFVRNNLDPADRLGEILFGLIMALGFTGAVRFGREEADSRELFVGILGCNIAWGIVDGVMYVLTSLYERGRRHLLLRAVRSSANDEEAMARVAPALEDHLGFAISPQESRQLQRWIVALARREPDTRVGVRREDLLGAVAAGLLVILGTLPMLAPYLMFRDSYIAARVSNAVGLVMLYVLGAVWAKHVGGSAWRIGGGLMAIGLVLVGITILLGG